MKGTNQRQEQGKELLTDLTFRVTTDTGVDFAPVSDFPLDCKLADGYPKCCTEPDVSCAAGLSFLISLFFPSFRFSAT